MSNVEETKIAEAIVPADVESNEAPVVEETIEETPDDNEAQPDFVEEEVLPTDSKNVQKRIGKLAKKLSEKENEVNYWREQANNKPASVEQAAPVVEATGKPKLADFDNVEDYSEAVADWKWEQKEAQRVAQTAQRTKIDSYNSRVEQFKQNAPDFSIAVTEIENQIKQDPNMVEFIIESEFGPNIAYHLANNESEIARIVALSPVRRIAALSKIETEMAQRSAKPKSTAGNTSTKAPASRVTTNTGSVANSESIDKDQSFAAWQKWRTQNRKK